MQKWNEVHGQDGAVTQLARLLFWTLLSQKVRFSLSPSVQAGSSVQVRKQLLAFPAKSPWPVQHIPMLPWEQAWWTDACARTTTHMELTNEKLLRLGWILQLNPFTFQQSLLKSVQIHRRDLRQDSKRWIASPKRTLVETSLWLQISSKWEGWQAQDCAPGDGHLRLNEP